MRFRDLRSWSSQTCDDEAQAGLDVLGVVVGTSAIVLWWSLGIGLQANLAAELGDLGAATCASP